MTAQLTADPLLEARLAQRVRPAGRPAMYQSWRDLLFLHWRMAPEVVQAALPAGLTVDTFDGDAWIGIVPFLMRNIRPWWTPVLPGVSNFHEVNLRTYAVDERGVPGVWFLSLDADTRFGVWWGRTFYRLPYHHASMSHTQDRTTGRIRFSSQRSSTEPQLATRFFYRPCGESRTADAGSLEFFLVERYALFTDAGRTGIASGQVHHPPYEFCDADALADEALFELNGLPRPNRPPDHVIASRGVDVEVFALRTKQSSR